MKILFVSAEVAPYVSVGGLSQVMYFLPRSLVKRGHDVRIFTPRYGSTTVAPKSGKQFSFATVIRGLSVPITHENGGAEEKRGSKDEPSEQDKTAMEYGGSISGEAASSDARGILCDIVSVQPSKNDAITYLVENKEYFELRANVFGYADDHIRFALMSKACLEWLYVQHEAASKDRNAWWPDAIHCHDWHASYFIELARKDKRYRKMLAKVPLLLTVHNFTYQGNGDFKYQPEEKRDLGTTPLAPLTSPLLQNQNALRRGLLYADAVTTVSPTHAVEVLTKEYAEGLQDVLQKIRGRLSGILNGIDIEEFDPTTDPIIHRSFSRHWFVRARAENKKDLQKAFSLPVDANRPLVGCVGRVTAQKGWDLLLAAMPQLLQERRDLQWVVVGSGEEKYRNELLALASRFPEQLGLHLQSDFRLPRKVFSGADAVLMPSIFEPGGIVALEALRYGAVPVVRRTGGLKDSIQDFDPVSRRGTGFSFEEKSPWSLYGAIVEMLTVARQPALWQRLVANALSADFSWEHAADEYEKWYGRAIQDRMRSSRRTPDYELT